MKQPSVCVVIIYRLENPFLRECVSHCLQLDYPDYEILLLPDEKVESEFYESITSQQIVVRIRPTGRLNIPEKRNIGVKNTSKELIAFIDDDAYPSRNWLKNSTPNFTEPEVAAVGGPNLSPPGEPLGRRVSDCVMRSRVGFGSGYIRHNVLTARFIEELPTCNLIVRRSVFDEFLFDEDLKTGEDAMLCSVMVSRGWKILYSPDVLVFHHRRQMGTPLLRQLFSYGLFKGRLFRGGLTRELYFIVPTFFLCFLASGLLLSILYPPFTIVYTIVLATYSAALLFESVKCGRGVEVPLTALSIFLGHLSYGLGFLWGLALK
jgi:cellulose synthase/poly-beta-1,6-N-acetylglucosamine synthase-like glycosyltransferase